MADALVLRHIPHERPGLIADALRRRGLSTRTVDAHVKRLREKIGAARDYIETVRGVGYRFADAPLVEAS